MLVGSFCVPVSGSNLFSLVTGFNGRKPARRLRFCRVASICFLSRALSSGCRLYFSFHQSVPMKRLPLPFGFPFNTNPKGSESHFGCDFLRLPFGYSKGTKGSIRSPILAPTRNRAQAGDAYERLPRHVPGLSSGRARILGESNHSVGRVSRRVGSREE